MNSLIETGGVVDTPPRKRSLPGTATGNGRRLPFLFALFLPQKPFSNHFLAPYASFQVSPSTRRTSKPRPRRSSRCSVNNPTSLCQSSTEANLVCSGRSAMTDHVGQRWERGAEVPEVGEQRSQALLRARDQVGQRWQSTLMTPDRAVPALTDLIGSSETRGQAR